MRSSAFPFVVALAFAGLAPSLPAGAEDPLPVQASGRLYVSSFASSEVMVFDRDGSYLSTFTATGLSGTRGIVASSDGRLFVSSEATNRVFVFDVDGNPLTDFTAPGLAGPTGAALSPADEYAVCSFNNDSIFVFTRDGGYLRTLTPSGVDGPNCIAYQADGTAYVSSANNDRVIRLDANGQATGDFTGGGLDSPMSVTLDAFGQVYVSGGLSNNVVMFDAVGGVVGTLTHPAMSLPQGVAFDDRGHLYVSNFSTSDVLEFDSSLQFVRSFTAPGMSVARSIALEKLPPHVACRRSSIRDANGEPLDVLRVNGSAGNHHREVIAPVGGPLAFSLEDFPGAAGQPFPYVVFALPRENRAADAFLLPFGLGEACFRLSSPGSPVLSLFNTIGYRARLGNEVVPGTPNGPGPIFTTPQIRPGQGHRRVTVYGIVPECCLGRPASRTNAVVIVIP